MRPPRPLVVALLAGSAFALGGCEFLEPKVESPFTGRPVNEAGLAREIAQQEAKAKADAQAAADKAAADIRAAQATARKTAIDLQQRQAVTAAEIQATAARVEAETGQRIDAAAAAVAAATKALTDRMAAIADQGDTAAQEIATKRQQWGGLLGAIANVPVLKQATGAAGLDLSSLLNIALLGSNAYAIRAGRKKADQAWDEATKKAKAEAEAARTREDASWDAAQAQLLALHAAPPTPPTQPKS